VTAAYDYEDLHHLIDRLTSPQVRRLKLLVSRDEELSQVAEHLPETQIAGRSPADIFRPLIGRIHGPINLGERHDDYISEYVCARHGDGP
jgi:hypothetical protein